MSEELSNTNSTDEELQKAIDTVSQYFSDGNYGAALLLLKPLADAGVAQAIGMLGLAYRQGAGVDIDSEKAIELLQKAIELGDAVAAHHLGTLYQNGMPGVDSNSKLAEKYLDMSVEMGINLE